MLIIVFGIIILAIGMALLIFSASRAVEHSISLTAALGVSPLIIGFVFMGIGTNLPEIFNSIIASGLGHGDINLGDSIGSVLAQITMVVGLLPILGHSFEVDRKEVLVLGACGIVGLILVFSIVEKGFITWINGLLLVLSFPIYMIIARCFSGESYYRVTIFGKGTKNGRTKKRLESPIFEEIEKEKEMADIKSKKYHLLMALLGFIGVAIGSFFIVESIIILSTVLLVPEYLISFFVAAIGTSLPELAVDLTALRKKEYKLVIGDIIGSCIIDASLSVGIGFLFFQQAVSVNFAFVTILYTLIASTIVISLLAARGKLDKKSGIVFLTIYALSYLLFFFLIF